MTDRELYCLMTAQIMSGVDWDDDSEDELRLAYIVVAGDTAKRIIAAAPSGDAAFWDSPRPTDKGGE